MRPLFSYYGGKQRMSSKIIPLLPRHTVYVEPFAGGAAIFFGKPWPPATNTHHYREVLNDINQDIVNIYNVVRTPVLRDVFVERLQLTPYARLEHRAAVLATGASVRPGENPGMDLYQGIDPQVASAVQYYINLQCSFVNKMNGGWGTQVFAYNSGATWINKISRLPEYLDRMSGVYVECDDALSVIKRWDSPQTLFYCDPPYPGTQQRYEDLSGRGKYTQTDFQKLIVALDSAQGSFLLSGYPTEGIPNHWEEFAFSARCSASGSSKGSKAASDGFDRTKKHTCKNTKRTEMVWRMDRSANARTEVQDIWRKWGWQEGASMPTMKPGGKQ